MPIRINMHKQFFFSSISTHSCSIPYEEKKKTKFIQIILFSNKMTSNTKSDGVHIQRMKRREKKI